MKKILLCVSIITIAIQILTPNLEAKELQLSKDEVQFTFFSLPDGESMLISTGRNKQILINTGSKHSKKHLVEQIEELGIEKIDYLILTNNQGDTCGNTDDVLDQFQVSVTISAGKLSSSCTEEHQNVVEHRSWEQNKFYELSPGLFFRVIKQKDHDSMSLYILFGKNSLLFLAEGDKEIEDMIQSMPIKTEILKIPEYAVKNFPSEQLLEKLDPHIAIIFNLREHILHEGLLERLQESWIDVYHLKKIGTIKILWNLTDYELKK
ncbi:ComEC/Rec2 family competence protein [Salirhabdus salicampi]|uniref:ComEC/Rec2 family competence protein n=1 Tax=Salirhabdus salicampi TaxID=476102 RepID=UPI0020C475EE|nr:hypothetical protein [Salirhabdus salicampi]MCP8616672.1 hypothetical protein [Salirhabdus salicampi]